MRRYEGREPEEILPATLPDPVLFQPNKDYVRGVLAEQVDLTADRFDITADAPDRYAEYQASVHDDVEVPSEQVIDRNREAQGREYRIETEGEHPVERLRERELAGRDH